MIKYLERLREDLIDGSGWDKMGRPRPDTAWADLLECREFLEEQVDVVDGSYGQPAPNRAMVLVSLIDESLHGPGGF